MHCLGHSKPAPAQTLPSATGYLPPWWSTWLDNLQHPHWRGTFPSWLTEVISRGWRLVSCLLSAFLMAPSLARVPSCLASLSSNSKLLTWFFQHWSSHVRMCSPECQLKPFCVSHSSLRDRIRVTISGSASSCCCPDGADSSSCLTRWVGFLVLLQCLLQGVG